MRFPEINRLKVDQVLIAILLIAVPLIATSTREHWTWGSVEAWPLVERLLDPNYLKMDFFTNASAERFSQRTGFAYFLIALTKVTGVSYDLIAAYLNILVAISIGVSIAYFGYVLSNSLTVGLLTVGLFCASFYQSKFILNGFTISSTNLIAVQMAQPLLIFSLATALQRKIFLSLLLAGVASIFHPILGLEIGAISGLVFLVGEVSRKTSVRELLRHRPFWFGAATFLVLFAFSYIPYQLALRGSPPLDYATYFHILAKVRIPHHVLPASLPRLVKFWTILSFLVGATVFLIRVKQFESKKKMGTLAILGVIAGGSLVGIFIEHIPLKTLAALMPFRIGQYQNLFIFATTAGAVHWLAKNGRFRLALLVLVPFIPNSRIADCFYWLFPVVLAVMFFLVRKDENTPEALHSDVGLGIKRVWARGHSILLVLVILCLGIHMTRITTDRSRFLANPEEFPMLHWIRQNTPESAILAGPNELMTDVRLLARRAVLADRCFPFIESYYQEWFDRFTLIYGTKIFDTESYFVTEGQNNLARAHRVYGVTHAILPTSLSTPFREVYRDSKYKIVTLN